MSNTNIEDLSREDLLRVIQRDRFVKEQLSVRVAGLVHENLELTAIIQELQGTLNELREGQATVLADQIAGDGQVPQDALVDG